MSLAQWVSLSNGHSKNVALTYCTPLLGEQSVGQFLFCFCFAFLANCWTFAGKSYCLNHFADTSFAGSAMRTTEGVWLSCTPTDDYLLVSLDFEGSLTANCCISASYSTRFDPYTQGFTQLSAPLKKMRSWFYLIPRYRTLWVISPTYEISPTKSQAGLIPK